MLKITPQLRLFCQTSESSEEFSMNMFKKVIMIIAYRADRHTSLITLEFPQMTEHNSPGSQSLSPPTVVKGRWNSQHFVRFQSRNRDRAGGNIAHGVLAATNLSEEKCGSGP
jgi:hypothetical protein